MNSKKTILGSRSGRFGTVSALSCALLACPALGQNIDEDNQPVEVTEYGTVTLAVQDTDLAQVLEMLSIQSQKNIITSRNVSATISANLYDVTFYEALDSILKVNGYDYIEEGNFIYIYTETEMEELRARELKAESRIFELNYLSAADANELIAPLLSETGRSSFRGDVQPGIEPDSSDAGMDSWAFTAMLVVNDFPNNLAEVSSLLADLDVPPKQVLIESTILQTTLNEKNAFGIDFSFVSSLDFSALTNPFSGVSDLLGGSGTAAPDNEAFAGNSSVANIGDPGTLKVGVIRDDVSVFLRVLDQVSDTTVLARPKVMCLNRQRAEVLVGRRVGYLSTTATETSSTQTVEFLDTGIHLMFRPFIARDGMIRLELAPSVSDFVLREVAGSGTSKVTIPDEVTNELTTNVRVKDGQTLVLGGLFRESNDVKRRQVPILGDIPIVGAAFRGQDDEVKMDEIIFLITPSVVRDDLLWSMGDSAQGYSDAIQVGARSGLLPFSRHRVTEGYNQRAKDAFDEGQFDRALYFLNDSLRLNPVQPSMIRMRERINGAKETPYQRNQLERIMRNQMGDTFNSVFNMDGDDAFTTFDGMNDDAMPSLEGIESQSFLETPDGELNSVSTYSGEAGNDGFPSENSDESMDEFASRDTDEISIDEAFEEDVFEEDMKDTPDIDEAVVVEDDSTASAVEDSKYNDAMAAAEAMTATALAELEAITSANANPIDEKVASSELESSESEIDMTPTVAVAEVVDIEDDFDADFEDNVDGTFETVASIDDAMDSMNDSEIDVPSAPMTETASFTSSGPTNVYDPQVEIVEEYKAIAEALPYAGYQNSGVSTYPEQKVDGWPNENETMVFDTNFDATMDTSDLGADQDLVESLVNGYFASLGADTLASAPARREEEDDDGAEFAVPFVTFEDMLEIEVVEAADNEPFQED